MLGGHSEVKTDAEGLAKLAEFKELVEGKAGSTFATWEPTHYTTQVVSGTNYTFGVKVGDNEHIIARVYEPLPCNEQPNEVLEFKGGVEAGCPLDF